MSENVDILSDVNLGRLLKLSWNGLGRMTALGSRYDYGRFILLSDFPGPSHHSLPMGSKPTLTVGL